MIVTPDKIAEKYRDNGIWGRVTLDHLFRKTAAEHPDRLAIVDAPDRHEWTGGMPRTLTYAEAETEIERMAAFFGAVGLSTDHVIGIHAPNTVDTLIAQLAAMRAGLIVSPLPLHWRQTDVVVALQAIGAKGFIAADRIETRNLGTAARDAAADLFSLRFVFGLGEDIPDGLIDMTPMLEEMGDEIPPLEVSRENEADHVVTISWSRSGAQPIPVARSHNQWVAAGFMPFLQSRLKEAATLLVPYSLSGLTGIGAGIVPWLLSGGTLHLHHPTALPRLAHHADSIAADYVLVPGTLAQSLDERISTPDATILSCWNVSSTSAAAFKPKHRMIDLHVADEYGMVAHPRSKEGETQPLPLGTVSATSKTELASATLDLWVVDKETQDHSELMLRGPMVPDPGWKGFKTDTPLPAFDKQGYLHTGLIVSLEGGMIKGFGAQAFSMGGAALSGIDDLYAGFPGAQDAASFLLSDPISGNRLFAAVVPSPGSSMEESTFTAYLEAQQVDLAKVPCKVLVLPSLPRLENGAPDREALAMKFRRLTEAA